MGNQIKLKDTAEVNNNSKPSDAPPTDAELQALWDIGQLLYLANTYTDLVKNKGSPQPQTSEALAQFQKLFALYHISTSANGTTTATFDYNEGAQKGVPILNADILEVLSKLPVLSNPPSAADLTTFQTFICSSTEISWGTSGLIQETFLERMLMITYDAQYTMMDNLQNPITNTSLVMFYLSIVNSAGNIAAGTLDDMLSEGYFDGAMFNYGNIRSIAQTLKDHFANDTFLTSDVILAGLQIKTDDNLFPELATCYQNDTADGANEKTDWFIESFFFPIFEKQVDQQFGVFTGKDNTYMDNLLETEKKAMRKKDAADDHTHRISSN